VEGETAAPERCPRSLRTTLGTQGHISQAVGSREYFDVSRLGSSRLNAGLPASADSAAARSRDPLGW
jgi:hypothetical protein